LSREYTDPWFADLLRRVDMIMILIDLRDDPLQQLEDTLSMLREWRIFPRGEEIPDDLKKPPFIKRTLVVVNKMDEEEDQEDYEVFLELSEIKLPCIGISVHRKRNLSVLVERIYDLFEIIRVFTRAPGKPHDPSAPFVLPRDCRLEELAEKVHKDFKEKLKYARVWGKTVYEGQMVQRDYTLQDGDVVEMHL
jgi:ribosome-interacting GTPase 1